VKILGYNGRGLQGAAAIRALLSLQKRSDPDLDEWPAECLHRKLKMDFKEVVQSDGRSGGLLLQWKKEIKISLRFKMKYYIDVNVEHSHDFTWRFTGFYGEPKWQERHLTWQHLRDLHSQSNLPWLVMGDINEILYSIEKEGGNPRPEHLMQNFRDAIEDCNLADFGYTGHKFTWHRGLIRERLDRALTNEGWNSFFGDAVLQNMEYSRSDHRPILMTFENDETNIRIGPAVLRFEAKWLKETHFRQVVEQAWEQAQVRSQTDSLAGKLEVVHDLLHKWDKTVLKKTKRNIRNAQKDMKKCCADP
jgi:hypothetical protein